MKTMQTPAATSAAVLRSRSSRLRLAALLAPVVMAGTLAACSSDPVIVQQPIERERVVVREVPQSPTVIVPQAPPATRTEAIPPAPSMQHVWVPGAWVWRDGWVWQAGHYEQRPYANARWIDGRWDSTPAGWRWPPGRWG